MALEFSTLKLCQVLIFDTIGDGHDYMPKSIFVNKAMQYDLYNKALQ